MEFPLCDLERACELMKASRLTEFVDGQQVAIEFSLGNQLYHLGFQISPEQLAMLAPASPTESSNVHFSFTCNAIAFHPEATASSYMICFLEARGALVAPKLLIAGTNDGIYKMQLYSIPSVSANGGFEFPRQI